MARHPLTSLSGDSRDAWLQYERGMRSAGKSPRTIETYGDSIAQLQDWLTAERGGLAVIEATTADVEEFLAWLGKTRSASTAANRYRALVQWWKFLDANELADNIMTKVNAPAPNYKVPDVLTDDELRRLVAACTPKRGTKATTADLRDRAMLLLFCEPGSPRASEMAGLLLTDIDLEHEQVTVRDGKNGITRVIPIGPETASALFRYKRARRASTRPELWLGLRGPMTRSGIGQMVAERATKAGLGHVHPHQLRHTAFADFDDATGGHTNAEMALFGWRSPAMANYYGKAARARNAVLKAREMNRTGRLTG